MHLARVNAPLQPSAQPQPPFPDPQFPVSPRRPFLLLWALGLHQDPWGADVYMLAAGGSLFVLWVLELCLLIPSMVRKPVIYGLRTLSGGQNKRAHTPKRQHTLCFPSQWLVAGGNHAGG